MHLADRARRPGLTQLFSFDPAIKPRWACPCGWGCFWQRENDDTPGRQFQCERCGRLLTEAELIERPWPIPSPAEAPVTEATP